MSSSRFTLDSPQNNFQSGSGFAYVHSRGGALHQLVVACGSVKGTVAFYESTSATAGTQKAFVRAQVNTTGNPTFSITYDPPLTFSKKIKCKINGGGTGASKNGRMVVQVRFYKSTYRASTT